MEATSNCSGLDPADNCVEVGCVCDCAAAVPGNAMTASGSSRHWRKEAAVVPMLSEYVDFCLMVQF